MNSINKQMNSRKKVRSLVFALSILVLSQISKAQTISGPYLFMASDSYKPPRGFDAEGDLIYSKDFIFQANMIYKKASFNFQQFSLDLKFQKENAIDFQDKLKGDIRFINTGTLKTKRYVFVRDISSKTNETDYGMEFFPDKLSISEPVELVKTSGRVVGKPLLVVSEDKSKFLLRYKTMDSSKIENKLGREMIGLVAFDENLKKLWEGEFEMPYGKNEMQILDVLLADNGDPYILAGVGKVVRFLTAVEATYDYFEVLQLKDGKIIQGPQLKPPATEINFLEGQLAENPLHEIVIAGTYSKHGENKRFFEYVKGVFMTKIQSESAVSDIKVYDISMNTMKEQATERELKEIEKFSTDGIGYDAMEIRKICFMRDGSTKIITEANEKKDGSTSYSTHTSSPNPTLGTDFSSTTSSVHTPTSYNSGDALIFSIGAEKNILWVSKIKKNQFSYQEQNLGMNAIIKDNDLHLFYWSDKSTDVLEILKYNAQGSSTSTPMSIKVFGGVPVKSLSKGNGVNLLGNDKSIHKNKIYTLVIN
jgi:hypothetical protein